MVKDYRRFNSVAEVKEYIAEKRLRDGPMNGYLPIVVLDALEEAEKELDRQRTLIQAQANDIEELHTHLDDAEEQLDAQAVEIANLEKRKSFEDELRSDHDDQTPYPDQVTYILEHFDFQRVHRHMMASHWKWPERPFQSPTPEELKAQAKRLLDNLGDLDRYSHGGLVVTRTNGLLRLAFEVCSWDGDQEDIPF